jgi:polar amino acid transport system substrate-binding protein
MTKKDSKYNAITGLCCGATVATQAGSTAYEWVENELIAKGVKIKHKGFEDYIAAVEDLIVGRVSSVITDTDNAFLFIAEGRPVQIAGTIYIKEPYALAVTQGDPHGILPKINHGMMSLYKSGKWAEIVHKYIPGAIIKNIPANMPECIETYKAPIPGVN